MTEPGRNRSSVVGHSGFSKGANRLGPRPGQQLVLLLAAGRAALGQLPIGDEGAELSGVGTVHPAQHVVHAGLVHRMLASEVLLRQCSPSLGVMLEHPGVVADRLFGTGFHIAVRIGGEK